MISHLNVMGIISALRTHSLTQSHSHHWCADDPVSQPMQSFICFSVYTVRSLCGSWTQWLPQRLYWEVNMYRFSESQRAAQLNKTISLNNSISTHINLSPLIDSNWTHLLFATIHLPRTNDKQMNSNLLRKNPMQTGEKPARDDDTVNDYSCRDIFASDRGGTTNFPR